MQKKPTRICFISLYAYPLFDRSESCVQGGAEIDTYMIATELACDSRFDVHFITGDFGQPDIVKFENVTIYKTVDLKFPLRSIWSFWRELKKANCDIYFKKGASLLTALVAMFCRSHHKLFILRTSHKSECDGSYIKSQLLKGWAYKWTLKNAKQVFVQNAQDCELLLKTTGVQPIAIPNAHRITNSFTGRRKWILWVGRSVAFKRPDLFIKLARMFSSEQFVMICQSTKGDRHVNKPVEQDSLLQEVKKVPNLKFIDYVPFHEIDTYFEQAKVFINTSDSEGFPNSFIQACKSAVPILSINVNPDDFLNKYNCGLCANGHWSTFTDMFKQLLNPETMLEYGTNGRRYVQEYHDISKTIEQYKKLFETI